MHFMPFLRFVTEPGHHPWSSQSPCIVAGLCIDNKKSPAPRVRVAASYLPAASLPPRTLSQAWKRHATTSNTASSKVLQEPRSLILCWVKVTSDHVFHPHSERIYTSHKISLLNSSILRGYLQTLGSAGWCKLSEDSILVIGGGRQSVCRPF